LIYNRKGLESAYNNIKEVQNERRMNHNQLLALTDQIRDSEFSERISIRNVSFKYNKSDQMILSDVSLDINRNESVAFIGESGAGKSTLLDVLLGLLKPQAGAIYMDDKNIEDIPFAWAKAVGYVPQNVYLLDDTIRRNIAFGVEENQVDDKRIWECLKEASLDEFVNGLPRKLDTTVGDRGVRFSGGQRQRVAIARALYHNPQILVLDEATSALDNETEKEVIQAINDLQGKITIIIVAHRLTTIENCDSIYQVENGKVKRL
jgi:ABC-type bacteriocin/lantibiotic exporter with double-glycine peptidase domain